MRRKKHTKLVYQKAGCRQNSFPTISVAEKKGRASSIAQTLYPAVLV
jgi:hypothetical protein